MVRASHAGVFPWIAKYAKALWTFSVVAYLPAGALASIEAPCHPLTTARSTSSTVQLTGAGHVTRQVDIPSHSEVLITASQSGLNVTLEVVSAGLVIERAASPVYRAGGVHLALRAELGAKVSLVVTAKGHHGARGRVVIRTLFLSKAAGSDPCWRVQRLLALADGSFARGQATQAQAMVGIASDPKADALGGYRVAAKLYLNAAEQASTPTSKAYAQLARAQLLMDYLGVWKEANSSAQAAARGYERAGNPYGAARARVIGVAAFLMMSLDSGSESLTRTVEVLRQTRKEFLWLARFHARRSESFDQAVALLYLGVAYSHEGLYDHAIRAYRRSMPIFERLGEMRWVILAQQDIASSQLALGHAHEALEQFTRLIEVTPKNEADWLYFTVLNNSALANRLVGRMDVALQQYADALQLGRRFRDVGAESRSLLGIGSIYDTLGDPDRALDFYRQSLALRGLGLTERDRAASLRSTANVLRSQGHPQEALVMHEEALSHASTAPQRAPIQVQRARDLEALGRNGSALQQLEPVIQENGPGHPLVKAQALLERGKIRMSMGELSVAEEDLRSAIATFTTGESPVDAFFAWTALAQAQHKRGSIQQALDSLEHALQLAEEVRLESANPELRASLLQPLHPAFDLKITLLAERYISSSDAREAPMRQQSALKALGASEQARARAFADFERVDIGRSAEQARLLERRRALYRELAARHFQLESGRDDRTKDDGWLRSIRADISALRVQLDETDARINAGASTGGAEAARGAWNLERRKIPTDTAIVEYWLGAESACAWVVTRDRLSMVDLGESAKIIGAARAFHDSLNAFGTAPLSKRLDDSAHLYTLVIRPLQSYIAAYRTLIFVPDGALHYIPFGALRAKSPDRSGFLIESHDVAETPSITILLNRPSETARSTGRTDRLLLVADPVYTANDPRLRSTLANPSSESKETDLRSIVFRSSYGAALPRLSYTAREADTVASFFAPDQVDRLQGFTATKDRLLAAPLDHYRVIHVASHAMTDAQMLGLSALALSAFAPSGEKVDNLVFAADFMTLRLNADLVVLSACDTSLGKEAAGEGLMGLRYIVLARGAAAVVASLWEVPDEATSELMAAFYRSLLGRRKSVPAALSEAMRTLLDRSNPDPSQWGSFSATIRALESGDQLKSEHR
ncbi:MAG TPA: CHAT domain-containing tetratricopeptide repeat protein [Steroidobacteraceae bacterium]